MFELADGGRVELEGPVEFDSPDSPAPGDKAFVVIDESGNPVRWEPYLAARSRQARD